SGCRGHPMRGSVRQPPGTRSARCGRRWESCWEASRRCCSSGARYRSGEWQRRGGRRRTCRPGHGGMTRVSSWPAWQAQKGGTMPDLKDGESVEVQGSGSRPYVLKNVGGVYSCSCPAWRNQSLGIERRTCKHLRKLRGDAAEEVRIGAG